MYKYLKLLFVFLVPLLIMTCSDDPGGFIGGVEEAIEEVLNEITLALSGGVTDYPSVDGEIDQSSAAAKDFREGIASTIEGASADEIEITGVEAVNRNEVYVSFIFIEIDGATLTVEELTGELLDVIEDWK